MRQMKDSKIQWVGEIPSDWKCLPIYVLFDEVNRKNVFGKEKQALQFRYGTIVPKENFEADDDLYVAKTILNYNVVDPGTIMINGLNLNFDFVTQRVALVKDRGAITSAYLAIKPKKTVTISAEYMTYLLKSYDNCKAFHNMGGGVRKILNFDELKRNFIIVPSVDEQRNIARFLDKKCEEIDILVKDIEKQIEVLEKLKRTTITEAVTKGLNPDVELVESGVKWIGEIPFHWKSDKLKYHLKRSEPKNPGNVMVLSLYRDFGVIPKDSRDDNHNITSEDTSKYKYVKPGNFVVNKMKAWQGSVAVSNYEGIISPAYYVYEFMDEAYNKRYFHYLLRGCYKDEFMRMSGGMRVGQWDLAAEDLENTLILIPPVDEQTKISEFLDNKCAEIDQSIELKKEQIEKLEDYKKSLIFEYVTGKKEVV